MIPGLPPSEVEGARPYSIKSAMFEEVCLPLARSWPQMWLPEGKTQTVQGRAGEEGRLRGHREKVSWKNLRKQGGMKRGRDGQRMRPHFHCWWLTACHTGSIMIFDWQLEGGERVGKECAGREFRMGAAQNILPYRGPQRRSLMIKNVPGKACFLCMPAMLFVGWD